MTTAVQVQYRRGTSTAVASFTGAAGEIVIDTTSNRVVVQDGATAGGFAAAKLSEVQTNTRTQVSDGNYTALTTDRTIAYITLTAARTVALPAASAFPTGTRLLVVDESGNCSATNTLTLSRAGSDLIDGATSAVISAAYGYLAIESNGANKWTIIDQVAAIPVPSVNGLTGAITIVTNDGDVVSASGSTVTIGGPGGMVNKFRNGTMDVWQRGTSGTVTTAGGYGPDGWIIVPTGASVLWAQAGGRLLTKNSLQVTGATSVTDLIVKQRIESLIAAALCSQTVTVQTQIFNGTGGSITPTLTVKHAGSQDSWGSPVTDVNAVNLQACPNSTWTRVAYTFAANANSFNGIEISFDFGNNLGANTKSIDVTELDIRVTPGLAVGLPTAAAPAPPPELRNIAGETVLCQRYFAQLTAPASNTTFAVAAANSTTRIDGLWVLPATMLASPTITYAAASSYRAVMAAGAFTATAIGTNSVTPNFVDINMTVSGATAGQAGLFQIGTSGASIQASVEL